MLVQLSIQMTRWRLTLGLYTFGRCHGTFLVCSSGIRGRDTCPDSLSLEKIARFRDKWCDLLAFGSIIAVSISISTQHSMFARNSSARHHCLTNWACIHLAGSFWESHDYHWVDVLYSVNRFQFYTCNMCRSSRNWFSSLANLIKCAIKEYLCFARFIRRWA